MNILLLGKDGQIGKELQITLSEIATLTAWGRSELDLTDTQAIQDKIQQLQPQVIVNAAAYTAVDKAESEVELAMAVNANAVDVIARQATACNALLIHYSTDYVFDGSKSSPYTEQDPTNPLSSYGRSKLAGEHAITKHASRHIILRTTWVYAEFGNNFLNTIKRVAAQRPELAIVNDQIGAPTWSRDIARATADIIVNYLARPDPQQCNGIYHLSASGQTSWFGFAQAAAANGLFNATPPRLCAISTAEYPTAAQRPANSLLSNKKLKQQFAVELPDWQVSLLQCLVGKCVS